MNSSLGGYSRVSRRLGELRFRQLMLFKILATRVSSVWLEVKLWRLVGVAHVQSSYWSTVIGSLEILGRSAPKHLPAMNEDNLVKNPLVLSQKVILVGCNLVLRVLDVV